MNPDLSDYKVHASGTLPVANFVVVFFQIYCSILNYAFKGKKYICKQTNYAFKGRINKEILLKPEQSKLLLLSV